MTHSITDLQSPKVAVIGGGAAGFFAALSVKSHHPNAQVTIIEKTRKLLSKVKISGGGRCNVTNACTNNRELLQAYPRGQACLKRAFKQFNTRHTMAWFKARGVELIAEADGRVFPVTQRSQTIINCLTDAARQSNIDIITSQGIFGIEVTDQGFRLHGRDRAVGDSLSSYTHIIIATGGAPKREQLDWLAQLPQTIAEPVPSLFTFNLPDETLTTFPGVAVTHALVKIPGTDLSATGAVLVTHWGVSGPAVLKLSAIGARLMAEQQYNFPISINWLGIKDQNTIRAMIAQLIADHPKQQLSNRRPNGVPERLWLYLLEKMAMPADRRWAELGKKAINQLIEQLTNDSYQVAGKTTYKEEFVTCGGIDFADVNLNTLESKTAPNVYFAGEVLDIDGITGGYNFQAAWSTGFIAGKLGA